MDNASDAIHSGARVDFPYGTDRQTADAGATLAPAGVASASRYREMRADLGKPALYRMREGNR